MNADQFARSPNAFAAGDKKQRKTPVHYSASESDIAGSKATYADNRVTDEVVVLSVTHTFVDA